MLWWRWFCRSKDGRISTLLERTREGRDLLLEGRRRSLLSVDLSVCTLVVVSFMVIA